MKRAKAILWGIVFVLLGIIPGINALDLFPMNIFFDGWWTLLIIVPCFIGLFTDRDKTGSLIGVLFGTFLLLCSQKILSFSLVMTLLLPIIIVLIGLKMIFSSFKGGKSAKIMKDVVESGAKVHAVSAVFSTENIIYHGEEPLAVRLRIFLFIVHYTGFVLPNGHPSIPCTSRIHMVFQCRRDFIHVKPR